MFKYDVRHIYETLSGTESRLNPDVAYPIHKKLNFGSESAFNDLYDWIFNYINIPHSGHILDVGCGVGYGSFFYVIGPNVRV